MKDSINIINVIGSPINGGVQNFILAMSNYDEKYNIKRHLICLYSNKGSLRKKIIGKNISIHFCPIRLSDKGYRPYSIWKKIRSILGLIFFPIKFSKIIKESKAKIIFCHEPIRILEQLLISKIFSIPFVNHMHKEFDYGRNLKMANYIVSHANFISDSILLSQSNLINCNESLIDFKNIAIITSTSDLEKFKSKKIKSFKGGKINIGSIGRLNWEKNFKQLIKIGKKLKKLDMFDFQITIIGDGPDYINLKHLIKNEKLEKTIFLKGELSRDKVIDFLSNLDIYIQTSISEGSPLTIKEAMAVPLVVLASDVGGVGNLIQNNVNGFLVEKNNTDHFVETLLNVLKLSDKEIFKIKESARQFILLNFSPDMVACKLFKYLKEKID